MNNINDGATDFSSYRALLFVYSNAVAFFSHMALEMLAFISVIMSFVGYVSASVSVVVGKV